MKACFKCLRCLPLSEFYTHPMMADGHLGKCKECTKHDARARYENNRDRILEYDRARNLLPHRKRRVAEWHKNNPAKIAAQRKAHLARDKGAIARKPCSVCGYDNAEMHHPDYSKPLCVVWLCRKHHRQVHAGMISL